MAKKEDRHYWLKISEDFFDDEAVAWLEEKNPAYALFYLKLCLRAARSEGMLVRHVGDMFIPYEPKKLAEVTRVDLGLRESRAQKMQLPEPSVNKGVTPSVTSSEQCSNNVRGLFKFRLKIQSIYKAAIYIINLVFCQPKTRLNYIFLQKISPV